MRKAPTALVMLALASPLLSGCNTFVGRALGFQNHKPGAELRDGKEYAEQQLAVGKGALDTGQYALAIESFRNARLFTDTAADAYNGMAIAYLQLDRPDLAERFFKQAILAHPTDQRFQANLDRFYKTIPEMAIRTTREHAPSLASLAPPQQPAANSAVRVLAAAGDHSVVTAQSATGRMTRVSVNSVVIGTAAAPAVAPERRRSAVALASGQPERRRNPQYPARIPLAEAPAPAGTGYPVRIGLAAASTSVKATSAGSGVVLVSGPVNR